MPKTPNVKKTKEFKTPLPAKLPKMVQVLYRKDANGLYILWDVMSHPEHAFEPCYLEESRKVCNYNRRNKPVCVLLRKDNGYYIEYDEEIHLGEQTQLVKKYMFDSHQQRRSVRIAEEEYEADFRLQAERERKMQAKTGYARGHIHHAGNYVASMIEPPTIQVIEPLSMPLSRTYSSSSSYSSSTSSESLTSAIQNAADDLTESELRSILSEADALSELTDAPSESDIESAPSTLFKPMRVYERGGVYDRNSNLFPPATVMPVPAAAPVSPQLPVPSVSSIEAIADNLLQSIKSPAQDALSPVHTPTFHSPSSPA